MDHAITKKHLHDLGKLMLALVMLWAYLSFSQYLIIYSGNLPQEIIWYIRRLNGGWRWVGAHPAAVPLRAAVLCCCCRSR